MRSTVLESDASIFTTDAEEGCGLLEMIEESSTKPRRNATEAGGNQTNLKKKSNYVKSIITNVFLTLLFL